MKSIKNQIKNVISSRNNDRMIAQPSNKTLKSFNSHKINDAHRQKVKGGVISQDILVF